MSKTTPHLFSISKGCEPCCVILPSSYQGSPRAMRELYQDAMSGVCHFGKPSAFVTVTCNPRWPEIERMRRGRIYSEMPHIVSRVFRMYLSEIKKDLWENGVAGEVIHNIHTIDFQKRGLPHSHILLKFCPEDALCTAEDIDSLVCVEIPCNLNFLFFITLYLLVCSMDLVVIGVLEYRGDGIQDKNFQASNYKEWPYF